MKWENAYARTHALTCMHPSYPRTPSKWRMPVCIQVIVFYCVIVDRPVLTLSLFNCRILSSGISFDSFFYFVHWARGIATVHLGQWCDGYKCVAYNSSYVHRMYSYVLFTVYVYVHIILRLPFPKILNRQNNRKGMTTHNKVKNVDDKYNKSKSFSFFSVNSLLFSIET